MVTQPSTNPTQQGLTSVFGGEPVFFLKAQRAVYLQLRIFLDLFFYTGNNGIVVKFLPTYIAVNYSFRR